MEPNAYLATEQLLRKLSKQLRGIKIALAFFFIMFIAMLAVLGFIAYKVITFTHEVNSKIDSIQTKASQSLDFKSQICDNKTLTGIIGGSSDVCK